MRAPSSRTRRIISLSAAPVAVLLAGLMVWQGSNAAFSSETRNIGNSWETGTVALTDDDGMSAMFQIQNVTPEDFGEKCIKVTAKASVPGEVRLFVADLATSGLEPYIKVAVERGNGGGFGDCTGFVPAETHPSETLTSLFTDHKDFDTGMPLPWATAGIPAGESATYKFSWVMDVGAMNQAGIDALQGKATSVNFVWELQNT